MKTTIQLRHGTLLLAISALAGLGIGSVAAADTSDTPPVPQITFHIELVRATAGDIAKSGVAFDYTPFAPAVTGTFPTNLSSMAEKDEGYLATAHGDDAAQLLKYLHSHGKSLVRPTIITFSGVPASISITEPIKGRFGGGFSGYIPFTDSLSTKIDITPKTQPDGSIAYSLTLSLTGGEKQPGMTNVSVETIKTVQQMGLGETFALGGLASEQSLAPQNVPLLMDGLTKDSGFGGVDSKTPVLFVFVTAK